MKIHNSPAQARNLRDIEMAAKVINSPKEDGTVQPVQSEDSQETKEEREETEAESPSKKARGKKKTEEV